jgi:hypothetical protein
MKNSLFAFLALAAVLAITPAVKADDTFGFTYRDGDVYGLGTLTGTFKGSGIWQLTGGGGAFSDGTHFGTINLIGNPNYPDSTMVEEANPDYNFVYDDQLSLFIGPNQFLTVQGLYFVFSGTFGNIDLNLYQGGGGPGYDGWFEGNGQGDPLDPFSPTTLGVGTFAITNYDISPGELSATPEPGSILLLGAGLFALAGLLMRRRASAPAMKA